MKQFFLFKAGFLLLMSCFLFVYPLKAEPNPDIVAGEIVSQYQKIRSFHSKITTEIALPDNLITKILPKKHLGATSFEFWFMHSDYWRYRLDILEPKEKAGLQREHAWDGDVEYYLRDSKGKKGRIMDIRSGDKRFSYSYAGLINHLFVPFTFLATDLQEELRQPGMLTTPTILDICNKDFWSSFSKAKAITSEKGLDKNFRIYEFSSGNGRGTCRVRFSILESFYPVETEIVNDKGVTMVNIRAAEMAIFESLGGSPAKFHFPRLVTVRLNDTDGKEAAIMTTRLELLEINGHLDVSDFTIDPQKANTIFDAATKKYIKVPN